MWPLLAFIGIGGALAYLFRGTGVGQAAPETGVSMTFSPSNFVALPQGGIGITPATQAALVAAMTAAGTQVVSYNPSNGVMMIGPSTATVGAGGGGPAVDSLRATVSGPLGDDVWMSTLAAAPGATAEVISMSAGKLPLMGANEPPVAGSAAAAADLSTPKMVRFAAKGDVF